MIQYANLNEDGDMVVTNEDPSDFILLTTLWFTETTRADGSPYQPDPDTFCTSHQPDAPDGDEGRKRRTLERRIAEHNEWADKQEGRPRVKFAKQQVVLITPYGAEIYE